MLTIQSLIVQCKMYSAKNAEVIKLTITEEYTYIYDEMDSFGVSKSELWVTVL